MSGNRVGGNGVIGPPVKTQTARRPLLVRCYRDENVRDRFCLADVRPDIDVVKNEGIARKTFFACGKPLLQHVTRCLVVESRADIARIRTPHLWNGFQLNAAGILCNAPLHRKTEVDTMDPGR